LTRLNVNYETIVIICNVIDGLLKQHSEVIVRNQYTFDHTTMQKKQPAIELVARFHMEFEGIHPLIDGNGRTGRLLLNFELMQNEYLSINVKFTDRRRYYECFTVYHQNGDADPIISLVAAHVDEKLDRYLGML